MTTLERKEVAPMLTVAEMAALLSVNAATVRTHAIELGGVRVGRQWRFPPDLAAPTLPNGRGGYEHPTADRLR